MKGKKRRRRKKKVGKKKGGLFLPLAERRSAKELTPKKLLFPGKKKKMLFVFAQPQRPSGIFISERGQGREKREEGQGKRERGERERDEKATRQKSEMMISS